MNKKNKNPNIISKKIKNSLKITKKGLKKDYKNAIMYLINFKKEIM